MKTLTISLLVFVMAAMPDTPQPFAKRPILGVYTFEDSSFAAFGLMDDQPFVTFSDGRVRGIRPAGSGNSYEIGNALGLFDQIEGVVTTAGSTIELTKTGQQKKVGTQINFELVKYKFKNGSVPLAGTLILPPGPGPFPCVVFTHGSGSEHREASFGLAFLFASNGIAAFTYDKRFVDDRDENKWQDSFDNYAGDAIAAATMLGSVESIDAGHIGIYGHSQGGWVAPLAASKSDLFSFVILSAANAVTPVEQHLYNGSCALRQDGVSERAIQEIHDFREIKYEAGITGNLEKYTAELPIAKEKPWFARTGGNLPKSKFWMANGYYDAKPALTSLKCPVLIVAGELDKYSDTNRNMKLFTSLFEESENKDITYKVFPSANHALLETPTGKLYETEMKELKKFADGYLELLTSWVKEKSK